MYFPLYILNIGNIKSGGTGFGDPKLIAPQAGLMAELGLGQPAIAADDKFALPYIESAVLEERASQWDQMAEHTSKVIQLYPKSFIRAYLLNGLANLHLQHYDLAGKSAAEGLLLDPDHARPVVPTAGT